MMDFLLTSILVFGTGVLVGRLFYKLNPFLMIFGLIIGGAMFVMALELNPIYCVFMIVGIFYGLSVMRSRHVDASQVGQGSGSLLSEIFEFIQLKFLQSDAQKFRQQQAEEDSAYDAYKHYEQQAYREKQRAEENTQKAQADAEQAQKQYEQAQQNYEQEKQKNQQQSSEEAFVDTRSSYEILGVSETATLDEIKKAYRKLRSKLHEDKNQNRSPAFIKEAEKELVKVIHAYEMLTGKKA